MGKLTMHLPDGVHANVERIAELLQTCVTESGNEAAASGSAASRGFTTKRIAIRNCAELAVRYVGQTRLITSLRAVLRRGSANQIVVVRLLAPSLALALRAAAACPGLDPGALARAPGATQGGHDPPCCAHHFMAGRRTVPVLRAGIQTRWFDCSRCRCRLPPTKVASFSRFRRERYASGHQSEHIGVR